MLPRLHLAGRWVPAIVLAGTLLPASTLAQAGLSGDPFGGQAAERSARSSQFDTGFNSKSALGQLEELTGSTVDRSSSSRNTVTRSTASRSTAQSRAAQARANFNQEISGMVAGALIGALFDGLFSDNSAQQRAAAEAAAREAAARAAAEAEAFRVQQELARKARIRMAQRYRAEWDAREAEIGDRLGGAFDVTTTGTAFFGRPANPDADTVAAILGQDIGGAEQAPAEAPDASDSDPSVVDLRGSSLVVPLLPPPPSAATPGHNPTIARSTSRVPRWAYDWPETEEPPPAQPPSQLRGLWAYFGPWLGDWYQDFATETVKETLWGLAENLPGQARARALYDFNSQRLDLTETMTETYNPLMELALGGATNAAEALGSRYNRGGGLAESQFDSLEQRGGKVVVDAWSLAFKQFTGHFGAPDLGKLGPVSGGGSTGSLNNVPDHPDAFRIRNVLFGRP